MTAETPLTPVLSKFWDDPKSWTLETYREHDGYRALAKALTMGPDDGSCRRSRTRACAAEAAQGSGQA